MSSSKSRLKNIFIKLFFSLIKIRKKKYRSIETSRFLIVSTTAIGDTLWGTPAIKALRKQYPLSYIGVLTSPIGKELLRNNPHINEIFSVQEPIIKSFFSLLKTLKQKKIQTVLLFHASQRLILPLLSLIGAKNIIGTKGQNKDLDFLLTDPIEKKACHEIQRRCQIIEKVKTSCTDFSLSLYLHDSEKQKANALYAPYAQTKQFIAMHPGAADNYKRWPESHFIELGNLLLLKNPNTTLFITGSKKEKELVDRIANSINGAISVCGKFSIREFAIFLEKTNLFITNDTGPLHIASAMKKKTLAIFGPTDPQICGPYENSYIKVVHTIPSCDVCIKRKCKNPKCLHEISPKKVYKEAMLLLLRKRDANE